LQNSNNSTQTLGLNPEMLQSLNEKIDDWIMKFREFGYLPVFITSATIRPYFYRLINSTFPEAVVLSYTELPANVEVEFLGKVEI
jgi:flagellar biosynthesis protein FlhA